MKTVLRLTKYERDQIVTKLNDAYFFNLIFNKINIRKIDCYQIRVHELCNCIYIKGPFLKSIEIGEIDVSINQPQDLNSQLILTSLNTQRVNYIKELKFEEANEILNKTKIFLAKNQQLIKMRIFTEPVDKQF